MTKDFWTDLTRHAIRLHEYCEIRTQTNYPYTSAEIILHKKLLDILIIRYKININFIYQFNKSQQHSF